MTVPLAAHEQRTMHAEREDQMLQRTRMLVFDQIFQEHDILVTHFRFEFPERDPGGIDDGGFRTQVVDQTYPALSVEDFHMVVGGNIQVLHCHFLISFHII